MAPGVAVPDAGMTPDWFAAAPRPSRQGGSHPAAHARTILGCFVAACTKRRGCTAEFVSGGRPGTEKRDAFLEFAREKIRSLFVLTREAKLIEGGSLCSVEVGTD